VKVSISIITRQLTTVHTVSLVSAKQTILIGYVTAVIWAYIFDTARKILGRFLIL